MARARTFRKTFDGTADNARLQNSIEQAVGQTIKSQLLDGALIENIVFTGAGTQLVQHKLGRKYIGYFVTKNGSTSVGVAIDLTSTADNTLFIPLMASGADTISIWVF